ncbi:MAG: hypothetical protein AB7F38_00250 [Piscinibacter sp.]
MYYILQAVSAAGVLTMIAAVVLCFKPPAPRRKWLWLALVLLGFVYVSLHPVAESYEIKAAYVAFLAASRIEQLTAAPEDVGIVIPVGALIFLAVRRRLRLRNAA